MPSQVQKKQTHEFIKRCRSVLWRQDGTDKKAYEKWEARIQELVKVAKYNVYQASVQAAKDHACLKRLFREYDVSAYDPNPGSHPMSSPDAGSVPDIKNEEKEQSHRENLQWAIAMAGRYLRTNEEPTTTPNDAAFWLYQQACSEPKDFLAKFNQVESKGDSELDELRRSRTAGKRRIEEIESMLLELSDPAEEEGDDEDLRKV